MDIICANKHCSKKFEWRGGSVHFGRAKNHYCSRGCQNITHGLAGTPRYKILDGCKKRAKESGVRCTLTISDIPEIPKICPILGIRIIANSVAGPLDSSPSLDRLVPALGYVPGNVRIISNRANRIRSDATAIELKLIARDASKIEKRYENV
jgi:hypothetical protein